MTRLVRATVPMCPECGSAASLIPESVVWYKCSQCGHGTYVPHWGYCAVDVSGVVDLMRSVADAIADIPGCRDQSTRLYIMAKVTEGPMSKATQSDALRDVVKRLSMYADMIKDSPKIEDWQEPLIYFGKAFVAMATRLKECTAAPPTHADCEECVARPSGVSEVWVGLPKGCTPIILPDGDTVDSDHNDNMRCCATGQGGHGLHWFRVPVHGAPPKPTPNPCPDCQPDDLCGKHYRETGEERCDCNGGKPCDACADAMDRWWCSLCGECLAYADSPGKQTVCDKCLADPDCAECDKRDQWEALNNKITDLYADVEHLLKERARLADARR